MPKIDNKIYQLNYWNGNRWMIIDEGSYSYIYGKLQKRSNEFKDAKDYKITIKKKR